MERSSNPIEKQTKSPNVKMKIGGKAVNLCWSNTVIRIYRAPYGHFNHIAVNAPEQGVKGLFLDADLESRVLMTHSFPVHYEPEPDDHVLGIINSQMESIVDQGLDKLFGGEGNA